MRPFENDEEDIKVMLILLLLYASGIGYDKCYEQCRLTVVFIY